MKRSSLAFSALLLSCLLCACQKSDPLSTSLSPSLPNSEESSSFPISPIEKEITFDFKTIEKEASRINESEETKQLFDSALKMGETDRFIIEENCDDGMFIDRNANGNYGLKFGAGKNATGTLTLRCAYPVTMISFHCNVYLSTYQDWNTGETITNADSTGAISINQNKTGAIMQDDYQDREMAISLSEPSQELVLQNYSLENLDKNYRVFLYDLTLTYLETK